jgi:hypothetical protein
VPLGKLVGLRLRVAALAVTVYDRLALLPPLSVALTVKLDVPLAEGVPESTPVEPLRFSPAGKVPDVTA